MFVHLKVQYFDSITLLALLVVRFSKICKAPPRHTRPNTIAIQQMQLIRLEPWDEVEMRSAGSFAAGVLEI